MVVIHGTKKLLDRLPTPPAEVDRSPGRLGSWYATVLFWKPQVALLVDEDIYLPTLMPFAPAATLLQRFPAALETLLAAHGAPPSVIQATAAGEREPMRELVHDADGATARGSCQRLASHHRAAEEDDLVAIAVDLARTPIGPLYPTHVSPDRALAALAGTPRPAPPAR